MADDVFEDLKAALATEGGEKAIDRLCHHLEKTQDYGNLFYALLMKERLRQGISPIPTESAEAMPKECHQPYEDAIREAGRTVGQKYLAAGDIPRAWLYYRMIGENAPVAAALDKVTFEEDADPQPLIDIAFHQGVHPQRGFDWVLDRYGICNAITMVGGYDWGKSAATRDYCIGRLVRTLHHEVQARVKADIARREGAPPPDGSMKELLAGREWLFEDEAYHIDMSHLSSVVQMAIHLPRGEDLRLAAELCDYGVNLSPRLQYPGDPPFENLYVDYGAYLRILNGVDVEKGLESFRAKAEHANVEEDGTHCAEALVNLLLRLERTDEALAVARKHLLGVRDRPLSCPGVVELCQKANDYRSLADVARQAGDPVHYLAGLLAAQGKQGAKSASR